jgi:N-acetyl-anhydromuramyl-L-alanine amidase AmpD
MIIDTKTLALPPSQYIAESTVKTRLVLHHTVGGTAKSTYDFWRSDRPRVATAYMIERDGTVYQCFNPKFWAYHIGTGSNDADNKASIGIELCSEGALIEKQGTLFKFNARRGNEVRRANVYDNGILYRGFRWFDAYDELQLQSLMALVEMLLAQFPTIPRQTPKQHTDYLRTWKAFKGVVSHTHLRADKSDVHPGFPWARLVQHCNLTLV